MLLKSSQHFKNIALGPTLSFPTSCAYTSKFKDFNSSSLLLIVTAAVLSRLQLLIIYVLPYQRSKTTPSCGREEVINTGTKENSCRVNRCVCFGMWAQYLCCFGLRLLNFLPLEAERAQSVQGQNTKSCSRSLVTATLPRRTPHSQHLPHKPSGICICKCIRICIP